MKISTFNYKNISSKILLALFAFIIAYRDLGNVLIDVDLTLLVIAFTALSFLNFLITEKNSYLLKQIFSISIIILLMSFSLFWTRDYEYGLQKIKFLIPFVFSVIFLSGIIINKTSKFMFFILIISVYISTNLIFNPDGISIHQNFRLETSDDTNPNKLGKFFGFAIISFYFFTKNLKINNKISLFLRIIALIMFGTIIILSGAKGALFGLLVTLIIIKLSRTKRIIINILFLIVSFLLIMLFIPDIINNLSPETQSFLNRRFNLLTDETDSINSRFEFIQYGFHQFQERGFLYTIFGNGIGDFKYAYKYASYPHNIFIEVLFEMGIIGILTMASICIFLFKMLKKYDTLNNTGQFFVFSALYFLIIANSTGDISGNFLFFTFMLLLYSFDNILQGRSELKRA